MKNETAVFTRVEPLEGAYIHAEGFYQTEKGERKAFFHIGPQFGTVSRQAVNEAGSVWPNWQESNQVTFL